VESAQFPVQSEGTFGASLFNLLKGNNLYTAEVVELADTPSAHPQTEVITQLYEMAGFIFRFN